MGHKVNELDIRSSYRRLPDEVFLFVLGSISVLIYYTPRVHSCDLLGSNSLDDRRFASSGACSKQVALDEVVIHSKVTDGGF